MCQLALDMFGQTLNQRQIPHSFRFENNARLFTKNCSVCHVRPYMPIADDLVLHGLAWPLEDAFTQNAIASNFQTICIRCAVTGEANIGFWIPTALTSDHMSYFMFDGETLGADDIAFMPHPAPADVPTSEQTSQLL